MAERPAIAARKLFERIHAPAHRSELWNGNAAGYTAMQLQELHQRVRQSAAMLAEEHNWLREVLFSGWTGGGLQEAWQDLLAAVETLASQAGTAHRLIMAHGLELPQGRPVDDVAATLGEIVTFCPLSSSIGSSTMPTNSTYKENPCAKRIDP